MGGLGDSGVNDIREVPLHTRTKFCALALVLAIAAPVAISQVSSEAGQGRLLPSTAATYADYQGKVSDIMSKELGNAAELEKAIDTFGAPNIGQLSSGWVAYSGILAAQNQDFVKEVRNIDNYYGRERLMLGLERDLGYARTLKGGEQALQNVLAANARDTGRLSSAGAFVKEQSYKLQKVGWGKERVKNPNGILQAMKTSAQGTKPVTDAVQKIFAGPDLDAMLSTVAASPATADSLWDKFSVIAVNAPGKALGTVSPVAVAQQDLKIAPHFNGTANRMVTLAALHAIDAEKTNGEQVKATMADPMSRQCLEEAQQYLYGCVSTAYTRYELTFCLARHGLRFEGDKVRSMGSCFAEIAK